MRRFLKDQPMSVAIYYEAKRSNPLSRIMRISQYRIPISILHHTNSNFTLALYAILVVKKIPSASA